MKFLFLLTLLLSILLGDTVLKVATYNVENLFDLQKSGNEYDEYIPNSSSNWNQDTYKIKLKNITQVIKEIDADIIALEEVESREALLDLRFELKKEGLYYEYYDIADRKNTTVKVAILSKIPFVSSHELYVTHNNSYRNILETKFKISGKELYIFVNHWSSKAHPESTRLISAKALKSRIEEIGVEKNIIVLGDFNSDYEEHIKFERNRRLNDTYGKTGINHILETTKQKERASDTSYIKNSLYNLWYDSDEENRYSYIFKGHKEAIDNVLISQSLLDKKNIYYIDGTISNFTKEYLFKKKNINRWEISRAKVRQHKGKGYSDHLPVVAKFNIFD